MDYLHLLIAFGGGTLIGMLIGFVWSQVTELRQVLGPGIQKITRWRTLIVTGVAGLSQLASAIIVQIDADTLNEFASAPWAKFLNQRTADLITTICLFLIPILHMTAVIKAAKATPVDKDA
jgi:hypothetical protein